MRFNKFTLKFRLYLNTFLIFHISFSFASYSNQSKSMKISLKNSFERISFEKFNISKLVGADEFLISNANYNLYSAEGRIFLSLFQQDKDLFFEFNGGQIRFLTKNKLIHNFWKKNEAICNSRSDSSIYEIGKELEKISQMSEVKIDCPIEGDKDLLNKSLITSLDKSVTRIELCLSEPEKVKKMQTVFKGLNESILAPKDFLERLNNNSGNSNNLDVNKRALPRSISCVQLNNTIAQYSKVPPGGILLDIAKVNKVFEANDNKPKRRFSSQKDESEQINMSLLEQAIEHEIIHSLLDLKPIGDESEQKNFEENVVNFIDCTCFEKNPDICKFENLKFSRSDTIVKKMNEPKNGIASILTANSAEAQANEQVARALSANPEVRAAVVEVSALTANDVFPVNAPTSVSPSTRTLPVTDGVVRATQSADHLVSLVQRALIPSAQAAALNQPQTTTASTLSGGAGTVSNATALGAQNSGVKRNVAGVVAAPSGSTNLGPGGDNRLSSVMSSTSGVSKLPSASSAIAGSGGGAAGGLAKLSKETSSSASRGELSAQSATETSVIAGSGGGVLPSSNQASGRISATDSSLAASSASAAATAVSSSWAQTQSRIQEAVTYLNAASRIQGTPYKVISSLYNSEASTETREAFSSSLASRSMQIQYSLKQKNQVVGETDLKKLRVLFVDNGSSLEKQNLNTVSELGPTLNNTFIATDISILNQIYSLTNCFLGEKICLDQYFESQSRNIFSFKSKSNLHAKQKNTDSNKSLPVLAE